MKKAIKMPSIEQFRNAIHHIIKATRFTGLDENEDPIYNNDKLPVLNAIGTVKLHGTNASICYNVEHGIWAQSKKNIITSEKDNAGFAFFVENNEDIILDLIHEFNTAYKINLHYNTVSIYGEWAGKGIQKNVGISELDKKFYIFGIKVTPHREEDPAFWLESNVFCLKGIEGIFHVKDFKTFELDIDFNNPLLSQNEMVDMVEEVETECPVAKAFDVSGIGEGIVFEVNYFDVIYRWKMKGEKHAGKSKVKTAKKVDNDKLQLVIDIVEKVTPEWRLAQMYQETFDTLNGGKGDIKKTGDYLRTLINDVMKEEASTISEAGLIPKDINASISKKARLWFMKKLDEEAGI